MQKRKRLSGEACISSVEKNVKVKGLKRFPEECYKRYRLSASPCFMFKLTPSATRILNLAKRMGKMCALIWATAQVRFEEIA